MFTRAKAWAGERLITWGFKLLGVNVKSIANQVTEDDDDDGGPATGPVVTLSAEAKRMRAEAIIERKEPVPEPPLKGSVQERVQKARDALR